MLDKFYEMLECLNWKLKGLNKELGLKQEEWEELAKLKYTHCPNPDD